ncbi:MAG: pirin family protein [Deltaproteobacteria bacterium]|nr:pirin family protein [Deltaproteobacteria bacterium]
MTTIRPVTAVVTAIQTMEGAGFPVRRPFPTPSMIQFDPFLLLDHMGPVTWPPGQAQGAPDHPHRGFETVTYMLQGSMEHRDSMGNVARMGPGDVQWMTAGAGVVHAEMPPPAFLQAGGVMEGFQIWVNLPAREKMRPPRYQGIARDLLPQAENPQGVSVRVIAGEAFGVKAAIHTHTPIQLVHVTVPPGGEGRIETASGHNVMIYGFSGGVLAGEERVAVGEGQMAVFGPGDAITFALPASAPASTHFLLLAGEPIREPLARWGPFVMNTEQEIIQAFEDFQSGRMGQIQAE